MDVYINTITYRMYASRFLIMEYKSFVSLVTKNYFCLMNSLITFFGA